MTKANNEREDKYIIELAGFQKTSPAHQDAFREIMRKESFRELFTLRSETRRRSWIQITPQLQYKITINDNITPEVVANLIAKIKHEYLIVNNEVLNIQCEQLTKYLEQKQAVIDNQAPSHHATTAHPIISGLKTVTQRTKGLATVLHTTASDVTRKVATGVSKHANQALDILVDAQGGIKNAMVPANRQNAMKEELRQERIRLRDPVKEVKTIIGELQSAIKKELGFVGLYANPVYLAPIKEKISNLKIQMEHHTDIILNYMNNIYKGEEVIHPIRDQAAFNAAWNNANVFLRDVNNCVVTCRKPLKDTHKHEERTSPLNVLWNPCWMAYQYLRGWLCWHYDLPAERVDNPRQGFITEIKDKLNQLDLALVKVMNQVYGCNFSSGISALYAETAAEAADNPITYLH